MGDPSSSVVTPALIAGSLACASAIAATGVFLRYARRRLLDLPNQRSSHIRPTPRGGGIGIVLGLFIAWLPAVILSQWWWHLPVAAAVAAMSAIGFWDDHVQLPARWRLVAQAVAVALVMAVLWQAPMPAAIAVFGASLPVQPWLIAPFALLGALWIVNLTNFMDGIDGIAASHAGIVLATFAWWLHRSGDAGASVGFAAAAAACLGFLVWNWPPARIFMGDVGSTVLGFAIAIGILRLVQIGYPFEVVLLPHLPFFADATITLAARIRRRERLSTAHRSHFYQRLAQVHGHRPVTVAYIASAVLGVVMAEWALRHGLPPGVPTLLWGAGSGALAWWMGRKLRPVMPSSAAL